MRLWKVGELARQTGLTVRTLHYYDEVGLLSPSLRSEAGHRLYTAEDIARLQRIRSLRQLGFSLVEVQSCLERPELSFLEVIRLHISRLRERIEIEMALCRRLEGLAKSLSSAKDVCADEIIKTIEVMTMSETYEKYYSKEQLKELEERAKALGEERIRQAEAEWSALIDEVRAEMNRGSDPTSERVQALARRWTALVQEFTGGNPEISTSLNAMWQEETAIHGIDTREMRKMMAYVSKGMKASSG